MVWFRRKLKLPAPIPTPVRQEMDRTPEWWDREYRALVRRVFPPKPFNHAEHEGHNIVEDITYGGRVTHRACIDCRGDG
ncbi:hypothetical protein GCM10025773_12100 [Microbacterium jejuense]